MKNKAKHLSHLSETEKDMAKRLGERLGDIFISTNNRIKKLEEALKYCADHAHPSIVQDVAKSALKE